tara:strand:+ start:2035 stop:2217 length:183 start_codon:yes stop_codon:yes gene_type:complete
MKHDIEPPILNPDWAEYKDHNYLQITRDIESLRESIALLEAQLKNEQLKNANLTKLLTNG